MENGSRIILAETKSVEVELLGVARLLAQRDTVSLAVPDPATLADLTRALAAAFPALVGAVLDPQGNLLAGHVLCRGGLDLVRDPAEPVTAGESLLLLSTSAGG